MTHVVYPRRLGSGFLHPQGDSPKPYPFLVGIGLDTQVQMLLFIYANDMYVISVIKRT